LEPRALKPALKKVLSTAVRVTSFIRTANVFVPNKDVLVFCRKNLEALQ
jgi:hypothetical protein